MNRVVSITAIGLGPFGGLLSTHPTIEALILFSDSYSFHEVEYALCRSGLAARMNWDRLVAGPYHLMAFEGYFETSTRFRVLLYSLGSQSRGNT